MMTTAEASAHLSILETLEDSLDEVIDYNVALNRMWRPLEAFAPRCQNCRHKLDVSRWVDGVRSWRCNWCNVGWREATLVEGP